VISHSTEVSMSRRDDDFVDQMTNATFGCLGWLVGLLAFLGISYVRNRKYQPDTPENPSKQHTSSDGQDLSPQNTSRHLVQLVVILSVPVVLIAAGSLILPDITENLPYSSRMSRYTEFFVVALGISVVVMGALGWFFRKQNMARTQHQLPQNTTLSTTTPVAISGTIFTILVPKNTEWNNERALKFIEQLLNAYPELIFRIVADHHAIRWQVVNATPRTPPEVIEQVIRANMPSAEIEVSTVAASSLKSYRHVLPYQHTNFFVAPMLYVTDIKTHTSSKHFDPIASIAQAMSNLQDGEQVIYTLAASGIADKMYDKGRHLITQSTIHPLQLFSRRGIEDALAKVATGYDRVEKYVPRDQHILEEKLRQRLYNMALVIQIDAQTPERLIALLTVLDAQLNYFSRDPFNSLQWVEQTPFEDYAWWIETPQEEMAKSALSLIHSSAASSHYFRLTLEPREIAALWHLPHVECTAPRIAWASGAVDVPSVVSKTQDGVNLGQGKYQGRETAVMLPTSDRVTHMNMVGKTGTGKSTLMHRLIHQDIAAGRGVAVIDPHGTLVQDILQTSIPARREEDVVVLDLGNEEYPPPLNPLLGTSDYASTIKMVNVIEYMFPGTEDSPRQFNFLRAALLPLQAERQATMRDAVRMFYDPVFRQQKLRTVTDPETRDFWDLQYNNASASSQREIANPIVTRLRPFYANPYLYPILCHPDGINFRELVRQNKIILISLAMDEERVPEEERDLVGALLMARLQIAGMKQRVENQDPYFIYVDEVQRFVTTSLNVVLSEARKFGLSLVTANQFLGQLSGKTLDAVMGNVGTTVIFRCSPDDARTLADYVKPEFTHLDLVNLDLYTAVVKMQTDGKTQPAFTLKTLPPPTVEGEAGSARERRIRQRSIDFNTPKTRQEVLDWLEQRYNPQANEQGTKNTLPLPSPTDSPATSTTHLPLLNDSDYYDGKNAAPSE
jgi:hypothetical protein